MAIDIHADIEYAGERSFNTNGGYITETLKSRWRARFLLRIDDAGAIFKSSKQTTKEISI